MKSLRFNLLSRKIICLFFPLCFTYQLVGQTTLEGTSPQFLFPEFIKSKVRMKNGQENIIILNYNTVSEKMVYQKDNNLYDLINPEMTDTIFILKSKFVPIGKVYYEVIQVAPIPLFVQFKSELLPPGTPAGYGGTSQVSNTPISTVSESFQSNSNQKLPADFKVKTDLIYWLRKDGNMLSFTTARQFIKLFPDRESVLKQFIKENHIKIDRQSDVIMLAEYVNKIIK